MTARKKRAKKKAKPLRQSWRDLVSLYTRAKVAKAKTMAPGTKDVPRKANVRDHIKRAKKTGSVDDAARAIASIIDF